MILSLKNSFPFHPLWRIKIITHQRNISPASQRMTREKCSTKGAKAGCKAKDSWRLRPLIVGKFWCPFVPWRDWNKWEPWWSPHFPRWFCLKNRGITSPPYEQNISILLALQNHAGTFPFISLVSWIKRRRTAAWRWPEANRSATGRVEMRNPTIHDISFKENHFQERYGPV